MFKFGWPDVVVVVDMKLAARDQVQVLDPWKLYGQARAAAAFLRPHPAEHF